MNLLRHFTRRLRLCCAGVFFLGGLLVMTSPARGFDHQQWARETDCRQCHLEPPAGPPASIAAILSVQRFQPDGWKTCQGCHPFAENTFHPMSMPASPGCGLPLDKNDRISCLTCHSPHVERLASEPWVAPAFDRIEDGGHLTWMLTLPNANGELCRRCHQESDTGFASRVLHPQRSLETRSYAGSKACIRCHADIHAQWSKTPHARMTRTPENVPRVQTLTDADLEFPRERLRYVLGAHFVHRFVAQATDTLVVLPRILDQTTGNWLPVRDYGWQKRDWLKQCAGCHTTGFSADDHRFVEAGVGCEACHGPALNHVRTGSPRFVLNPAKLPADRAEMICESCHTSGVDNSGQYHFPVGYKPGDDLTRFYSGLTPKPGQDQTTFAGDETYEDRRRQWNFLKERLFLAKGLTCDYCRNFRSFDTASGTEYLTHDQYCLTCHTDRRQHPASSPGENCTKCHMPTKTPSGAFSIHDHKFAFPPQKR